MGNFPFPHMPCNIDINYLLDAWFCHTTRYFHEISKITMERGALKPINKFERQENGN